MEYSDIPSNVRSCLAWNECSSGSPMFSTVYHSWSFLGVFQDRFYLRFNKIDVRISASHCLFFSWKPISKLVIWQIFRSLGHSLVNIKGLERKLFKPTKICILWKSHLFTKNGSISSKERNTKKNDIKNIFSESWNLKNDEFDPDGFKTLPGSNSSYMYIVLLFDLWRE